jgi:metalloendopeptidase OMA1, mitochondrial
MNRRDFLVVTSRLGAALPLLAIPGISFLTSCAKAPYTGRSQLMLISSSQEMALGQKAAQEVLKKEKLSTNPKYVKPLDTVGGRIAKATEPSKYEWEFKVVDNDETVNAFALPGGKVFIYTGLYKPASTDAELAAVVAHEAGHIIARHGAERMSMTLLAQVGGTAARIAIGSAAPEAMQAFNTAFGMGVNYGVILPFSREQEYEADRIGLILMAKAGYNPEAALKFWEKMAADNGKQKPPEYLSTHPSDANRIAAIKSLLPEAMSYYKKQ